VPDKKLAALVAAIIVLSMGHDIDHAIRGDFHFQLSGKAIPVIAAVVAKYAIFGFGLYLYFRGKVGPLFWAILAGIGVVLGTLAHFSPFSDQTPRAIYRAYEMPAAGMVAVTVLALLMLALIATAVYSQYPWARRSK
jgi:fluoride ion exporter CrcB/FEX